MNIIFCVPGTLTYPLGSGAHAFRNGTTFAPTRYLDTDEPVLVLGEAHDGFANEFYVLCWDGIWLVSHEMLRQPDT